MIGEVQYGSRVTDDYDKRLLNTYAKVWFSENMFDEKFEFYSGESVHAITVTYVYSFIYQLHRNINISILCLSVESTSTLFIFLFCRLWYSQMQDSRGVQIIHRLFADG